MTRFKNIAATAQVGGGRIFLVPLRTILENFLGARQGPHIQLAFNCKTQANVPRTYQVRAPKSLDTKTSSLLHSYCLLSTVLVLSDPKGTHQELTRYSLGTHLVAPSCVRMTFSIAVSMTFTSRSDCTSDTRFVSAGTNSISLKYCCLQDSWSNKGLKISIVRPKVEWRA